VGERSQANASNRTEGGKVEDLLSELNAYERATIALRLDEDEARALADLLMLYPGGTRQDHDRIALVDKLAYEMDAFKWRRLDPVDLSVERTDNVAIRVNTEQEATMPTTKARTEKAATTKVCTRCKKRRKVEQFYKDKYIKDGLSSWCKSCTKAYDREYAKRKKEQQS
jgi:hypothetical protein